MDLEKIYKTPSSQLREDAENHPEKSAFQKAYRRFYISFFWCFPIFMFFVIGFTPTETLLFGALGSMIFSIGSGMLAAVIPSQRKLVYVSISVVTALIVAYMIGKS